MPLSIVRGKDAHRLRQDADFLSRWQHLRKECTWATAYQGSGFVNTWYSIYEQRYEPLLVSQTNETNHLVGFLPVALEIATGRLVVAGAHQCEYQAWLARAENGASFVRDALQLLARETRSPLFSFKYLPPGAPVDWANSPGATPWNCEWTPHPRPIIRLDDTTIVADYIKQKTSRRSTKNYRNRLRRIGELRLDHLRDPSQLAPLFDRLISFYDTRQGAANNSVPFQDDPGKKPFHLALLQCPDLLHVTVLKAGDEVISALFGITDGKIYSLAMPMFSPVHADNSPVLFHILMLVESLQQQDYSIFDLTPGGDPFKERFANDHDAVSTLTVYFRSKDWRQHHIRLRAEETARRGLRLLHIDPKSVRRQWDRAARVPVSRWPSVAGAKLSLLAQRVNSKRELRIYSLPKEAAAAAENSNLMSRDCLADLLAFQPVETWQTRQDFLFQSLKSIEAGHHFYTRVEDGRLAHFGWLIDNQKKNLFPEVGQEFEFPPGSAVLYNFYTDPEARGKGLYKAAIRQMLRDAAQLPDVRNIFIAVLADNGPSRHVIEKLGFRYVGSLFQSMRFGRTDRWSNLPASQVASSERNPPHRRKRTDEVRVTRALKLAFYRLCKALALFRLAAFFTRRELRILCYHGFSIQDESQFRPKLFIRPETFAQRMRYLHQRNVPVLSLSEAMTRLASGTLPPLATVLTVDDGFYSVFSLALPVLHQYRFPATVYVTTYYVEHQNPIFRLVVQYLFWKTNSSQLDTRGLLASTADTLDLRNASARDSWMWEFIRFGETQCHETDRRALAGELAKRLGLDYSELVRNRAVSLMTAEEIRALLSAGVDIQLHTHRHRFPTEASEALRELRDNDLVLQRITGRPCHHFCYPSGVWSTEHWPSLEQSNVQTAVTCLPGLNSPATPPLALSRFLDGENISQIEFEAEISGFAKILRHVRAMFRDRETASAPD